MNYDINGMINARVKAFNDYNLLRNDMRFQSLANDKLNELAMIDTNLAQFGITFDQFGNMYQQQMQQQQYQQPVYQTQMSRPSTAISGNDSPFSSYNNNTANVTTVNTNSSSGRYGDRYKMESDVKYNTTAQQQPVKEEAKEIKTIVPGFEYPYLISNYDNFRNGLESAGGDLYIFKVESINGNTEKTNITLDPIVKLEKDYPDNGLDGINCKADAENTNILLDYPVKRYFYSEKLSKDFDKFKESLNNSNLDNIDEPFKELFKYNLSIYNNINTVYTSLFNKYMGMTMKKDSKLLDSIIEDYRELKNQSCLHKDEEYKHQLTKGLYLAFKLLKNIYLSNDTDNKIITLEYKLPAIVLSTKDAVRFDTIYNKSLETYKDKFCRTLNWYCDPYNKLLEEAFKLSDFGCEISAMLIITRTNHGVYRYYLVTDSNIKGHYTLHSKVGYL